MKVFPVAGGARFSDDFGDGRSGGRTHLGNDLFAPSGTPLLAADDGDLHLGTDVLGGNIANVYADDGTRYYYAHLQAFAGSPRRVRAGEVIGYVGTTGNAAGTPSHLHFEVHPDRGAAVDPYPLLLAAPRATASASGGVPPAVRLLAGVGLGLLALRAFAPDAFGELARWVRA